MGDLSIGVNPGVERLVDYLHARTETEYEELARELHDHLGGFMVAVLMDLSWAEKHLPSEFHARVHRMAEAQRSGIDLKRKLVERLRPSLLKDMGLYAALGWLIRSVCARAEVTCTTDFSSPEPDIQAAVAIEIYRIVQEASEMLVSYSEKSALTFSVQSNEGRLLVRLATRIEDASPHVVASKASERFDSITHRARRIAGTVDLIPVSDNGIEFLLQVPISGANASSNAST